MDFTPTSEFPLLKFKFETFNPVQSQVLKIYGEDINIVIGSSTSSGKTAMAEMIMAHTIEVKKKKAIFLSPLKAVSQEKYDDWTDPLHGFSKYKVSIVTGDYRLTESRIKELNEANIIIMTTEMLDFRTRKLESERNEWLKEVGCVVYDEFHLLCLGGNSGSGGRGDKVESSVMRFTRKNPLARVVALSATMPNTPELGEWFTKLNGKKTECIISDYRPVKLEINYEKYVDKGNYADVEDSKMSKSIEIVKTYPNDKFIIFCHTKNTARALHKKLEFLDEKADIHMADLDIKTRKKVVEYFKGDLRIIVATPTLCWGINLPSRRVIVNGLNRGMSLIEPLDCKQMVGRAGRTGLDSSGSAHILLPSSKFNYYKDWCENIPPIKSVINEENILAFHIIAEICEDEIRDAKSLIQWYNRSLAAFQNDFLDIVTAEEILKKLERIKVIKKDGNVYSVTKLGQIASSLYFSPYSIAGWYFNFKHCVDSKHFDDVSLSWALANIPQNNGGFVGREYTEDVRKYKNQCLKKGMTITDNAAMVGLTIKSCLEDSSAVMDIQKLTVKYDIDRIISALEMIDSWHAQWDKGDFWKKLGMRIRYEVPEIMTELCTLKGIGGTRVKKLFEAGIRTKKDFMFFKEKAAGIVGKKVYASALE